MSWFKREQKPVERRWWEDDWAIIKEEFPIGRKFQYLGRTLLVTGVTYEMAGFPHFHSGAPILQTEYCDDRGKLHEWEFPIYIQKTLLLLPTKYS